MPNFITGSEKFEVNTPWNGWAAFFTTLGLFLFQLFVALVVGAILVFLLFDAGDLRGGLKNLDLQRLGDLFSITVFAAEVFAILAVLHVSGLWGGDRSEVLLLRKPRSWFSDLGFGIGLLVVFYLLLALVMSMFFEQSANQSQAQMVEIFSSLAKSEYLWAGILAIVIGAPLFEEFVFRGFLLTALTNTRLGFIGATVLTSALWAVLHAGYAPIMMFALFLFGLLLAIAVRRSGSVWIAVIMHALWNGTVAYGTLTALGGA